MFLVIVLGQDLLEIYAKIVNEVLLTLSLWNRSNCTFILSDVRLYIKVFLLVYLRILLSI